jgi:hypothetical protein
MPGSRPRVSTERLETDEDPMKRTARLIAGAEATATTVTLVWLPTAAHAGLTATGAD